MADVESTENSDPVPRLFTNFSDASNLGEIADCFQRLCKKVDLNEEAEGDQFYASLKQKLTDWRCQAIWKLLDERAALSVYKSQQPCQGMRVLVVGAGPVGLRGAIEAALLGAKVDLVEKRTTFSRNNVLHLWPFLLDDLKALGAKKFYGKFASGAIDHISIRTLQCILLKVCLILGVKVHFPVTFESLVEPKSSSEGWKVRVSSTTCPVSTHHYSSIIAADGKKYCLPGFEIEERRLKLALGITVNFVNNHTPQEVATPEISGVAAIYKPDFFKNLKQDLDIELENIVYYKDETHYFVMTAKKPSLLRKGVIKKDYKETRDLLSRSNISRPALEQYAREAATFATNGKLGKLQFARKDGKENDVAIFDFTSFFSAKHAARVVERKGKKILLALAGDSLLEPFWPTGSGLARGFLGLFDDIWMLKQYAEDVPTLDLLEEREALLSLLPSTSPERLAKNTVEYTIDPKTRYQNLKQATIPYEVDLLCDSDTVSRPPARKKAVTPKPDTLQASVPATRSSSMVERCRNIQRSRKPDQRPPSWLQQTVQQKAQPVQVEQLPAIEKLPPMPPQMVSNKPKQQERSVLGKLARLLLWWRTEDSKGMQTKPKHARTGHKERKTKKQSIPREKKVKSKGKSPKHGKKSQDKGAPASTEALPTRAQESGVKVHDLAKKFSSGFGNENSPSVVRGAGVSGSVQKGSVASAIQRLEENIKEKKGIDLTDYEEMDREDEYQEEVELEESEDENEEVMDEKEELEFSFCTQGSDDWKYTYQQRWRFCDDLFIQLYSGCADKDIQHSSPDPLWVGRFRSVLAKKLNELRQCYRIQEVKATLEMLNFIYRNIVEDPFEETYRRILLANDKFRRHVCNYPEALQFLWSCGWMEVDCCMVLPIERSLAIAMPVLDRQIQLADLVLQAHHINQRLVKKNKMPIADGESPSGRDSVSPVEELGENMATEGVDFPQLKRKVETDGVALCGKWPQSKGGLRHKTSTYALYLSEEEMEDLERMISAEENGSSREQQEEKSPSRVLSLDLAHLLALTPGTA